MAQAERPFRLALALSTVRTATVNRRLRRGSLSVPNSTATTPAREARLHLNNRHNSERRELAQHQGVSVRRIQRGVLSPAKLRGCGGTAQSIVAITPRKSAVTIPSVTFPGLKGPRRRGM